MRSSHQFRFNVASRVTFVSISIQFTFSLQSHFNFTFCFTFILISFFRFSFASILFFRFSFASILLFALIVLFVWIFLCAVIVLQFNALRFDFVLISLFVLISPPFRFALIFRRFSRHAVVNNVGARLFGFGNGPQRQHNGPTRAWTADLTVISRTLWPTELWDLRREVS